MQTDQIFRRLAQRFVDAGVLPSGELAATAQETTGDGRELVRALLDKGSVKPLDALSVVAGHIGVEFVDPTFGFTPDPEAIGRFDREVALAEGALPIGITNNRLVVAVADPLDEALRARLAAATTEEITLALGPRHALDKAVREAYAGPQAPTGAPTLSVAEAPPAGDDAEAGFHINDLLEVLLAEGGSDLHLTAGSPPQMRVHGDLRPIEGHAPLKPQALRNLVYGILTARQREEFEEKLELDASHPVPGRGRFRINVFFQRGAVGAVMRAIPNEMQSLQELGMPSVVREFAELPRGLVLVTGATGSGKSTTLAALIDDINSTRPVHIMTVEDPIEFVHHHKRAIVNQREVGADTSSFAMALRHVLRQDPDVILVGEMRDLETMSTALTAAETGHLVFATLHTQDAPGSIERVIDVFPPHQQQQVRIQLAASLAGVVSQQLVPTVDGKGRAAAVEVLIGIPAISNMIREGKVHQVRSAMQAGGRHGMQTMDRSLAGLVKSGRVDLKVATERAHNVDELMNLLGGAHR